MAYSSRTPQQLWEMRENWQWHDWFQESQDYLKTQFGLNLTLIEKVYLKNIVQKAFKEAKEIERSDPKEFAGFDIDTESAIRFIHEAYGITPHLFLTQIFEYGGRQMDEYLQILQCRMHMP